MQQLVSASTRCSYYVEIIDQNTEHNTEVHSDTLYFKFLLHCIYKMSGIEKQVYMQEHKMDNFIRRCRPW